MNKHQIILSMHPNQVPNIKQVLFTQDETDPGSHPDSLYIAESRWEDLGEPTVITITVEPGDLLNPPDDGAELLHRDAGTGRFVTEEFAEENPDTTVTES